MSSTDPNDQNVVTNTIVDGMSVTSVITFSGTETDACVLSGFTIRNGCCSGGGAGIQGDGRTATIAHCIITQNMGNGLGNCNGIIRECTITHNGGSGLYSCDGTISDCIITDCDATITNCIINNNSGGGLDNCDGAITNFTISREPGGESMLLNPGTR